MKPYIAETEWKDHIGIGSNLTDKWIEDNLDREVILKTRNNKVIVLSNQELRNPSFVGKKHYKVELNIPGTSSGTYVLNYYKIR